MAWQQRGIAAPVLAVNPSGAQFKLAMQLDKVVVENLKRCRIRLEQLELELTESVLLETVQRHGECFKRLQQIGVRLAIDDFGTGYSSQGFYFGRPMPAADAAKILRCQRRLAAV
jgi:EAL domain-containing protein (putative c-di-GMP-specific phosphodiesterase class I)